MPLVVRILYNFTDDSGFINPVGNLLLDSQGNLFGTLQYSSAYELANTATGYASTITPLATFDGVTNSGNQPLGDLTSDPSGDLFGTTSAGGSHGDGTVFEIANTPTGFAGAATLVSFNGSGGSDPQGRLIADANGDLFGTTTEGGLDGVGTVFEIANTPTGYADAATVLVSFDKLNGGYPIGGLLVDANGDLVGTTAGFGSFFNSPYNDGTVFEIAKSSTGFATTSTILATFNGPDGSRPGDLVADAKGDLFGTTQNGGAYENDGTVFEIVNTPTGYSNTPVTLASFYFGNGAYPNKGLVMDANGDLFGTTAGFSNYPGTAFEIANTPTGYASSVTTLVSFDGAPSDEWLGESPSSGLTVDSNGDLFGTTSAGGTNGRGTIFEITGSGFVPVTCFTAGTQIATPHGEVAVEDLNIGSLVTVLMKTGSAPVVWIGRRHIACSRHSRPEKIWPIRVKAGAFGPAIPRRDLFLSPDHAVYVGQMLVPIKYLVNGTTIAQVRTETVCYYHLELPWHDIVLAEGLSAESYLDTGNRANFENAGEATRLFPDFANGAPDTSHQWEAFGCAPLVVSGTKLEAVRRDLRDRPPEDMQPPSRAETDAPRHAAARRSDSPPANRGGPAFRP